MKDPARSMKFEPVTDNQSRHGSIPSDFNGSAIRHQHTGEIDIAADESFLAWPNNIEQDLVPLQPREIDVGMALQREVPANIDNKIGGRRALESERRFSTKNKILEIQDNGLTRRAGNCEVLIPFEVDRCVKTIGREVESPVG